MAFFTITSNDVTLLANQASSPGTGWSSVANVQAAFDQARTSGTPLFIQPGTYATSEIDITTATGSGKPLWVYAIPGAVTLQFTSGNTLFYIAGIASRIEGLVFDGNNAAFSNPSDSSALLTINGGTNIHVEHCIFTRSTKTGVYIESGAVGEISKCDVNLCSYAIWSQDSQFIIKSNTIENCTNGGIRVWRSSVTGDSSSVTDNFINTIGSQSGTGANGNGINILQAVGVTVIGNRIANCQYSAIRFNSGGDAVISGNACYNSRETAIFIEAPAPGSFFNGGIVSGNIVDGAGDGIKAVNLGETGQGTARRVTITGNTISGTLTN